MTQTKKIGDQGESFVCEYLEKQNYIILERNYFSIYGEIDIIAEKNNYIVFVEVKTRKNKAFLSGIWDISSSKQNKITKTALDYLSKFDQILLQPRFDVAILEYKGKLFDLDYLENAF